MKKIKKIAIAIAATGTIAAGGIATNNYVTEQNLEEKVIEKQPLSIEEAYSAVKLHHKRFEQKGKPVIEDYQNRKELLKDIDEQK